ncbi:MAG TPA: DUF5715 family protein [Pyrinomonadaceae bacterium]
MAEERAGRGGEPGRDATGDAPAPLVPPASTAGTHAPRGAEGKPQSPRPFNKTSTLKRWLPLAVLVCGALAAYFLYSRNKRDLLGGLKTGAEQVKDILTGAPPRDPYAEAVSKAEGDRGEPTGRKASVGIPAELKQYSETRRFLAIQGAAAAETGATPPHDFAELAARIRGREGFVEVPRLGESYVLYGVGLTATGALTHYDLKNRKVVPLFSGVEELEAAERGLSEERERLSDSLKEIEVRLKELGRKERDARARLLADAAARRKDIATATEKEKLLAAYYGQPGAKERARAGESLFAEYAALDALARDFGGRSYDLRDPAQSREFQARMLSHVRPAALALLEELAGAYKSKFDRPLPVTSLVRTDEYQRLLRESGNPNAADVAPPPHTTGLAFDIYYRYMTAEEQEFVMAEIARLESAGRVEALRELRDHYHVFVFEEGRPPSAESVDRLLGKRGRAAAPDKPEKAEKAEKKAPEKTARAKKEPPKKEPAKKETRARSRPKARKR